MCDSCGGHDHTSDELWLTTDEIADIVLDAVESGIDALMALPRDASEEDRREAMRAEFDRRRAERVPARPKTRAELREERARRRWGG